MPFCIYLTVGLALIRCSHHEGFTLQRDTANSINQLHELRQHPQSTSCDANPGSIVAIRRLGTQLHVSIQQLSRVLGCALRKAIIIVRTISRKVSTYGLRRKTTDGAQTERKAEKRAPAATARQLAWARWEKHKWQMNDRAIMQRVKAKKICPIESRETSSGGADCNEREGRWLCSQHGQSVKYMCDCSRDCEVQTDNLA